MQSEFGNMAFLVQPADPTPAPRGRYEDGDYSCCYFLKDTPTGMTEMMLPDDQNPGVLRPYSIEECNQEMRNCLFAAVQHEGRFVVHHRGVYMFIHFVHEGEVWSVMFEFDAGRILFKNPNIVIGTVMYKTFDDFFKQYRRYFKELAACAVYSNVGVTQTNMAALRQTGQDILQSFERASKKAWCSIM